jgi:hypothetical protein
MMAKNQPKFQYPAYAVKSDDGRKTEQKPISRPSKAEKPTEH